MAVEKKRKEKAIEKEKEKKRAEAQAQYGDLQSGDKPALVVNDPKIAEMLIAKLMGD